MTMLETIQAMKELWTIAMPSQIGMPTDQTFFGWVSTYPGSTVEYAIVKTSKKMRRNVRGV